MKRITFEYAPIEKPTQPVNDDMIIGWGTKDGFVLHPDFKTKLIERVEEVDEPQP